MRTKTDINVQVIDTDALLSKLQDRVTDAANRPRGTKLTVYMRYGLVWTAKGHFLLCSEGVGGHKPVEEQRQPIDISVEGEYAPLVSVFVNGENVHELPVKESVELSEFIREFGSRLEQNFQIWKRFLTPIAK